MDEPPEDRSVYVSFSPLHLFFPLVELTAEVRLHRQLGVAAIGGIGSLKEPLTSTRFTVWEVGGQIVGYPVGHFDHGMQLGVEVMYMGVSGDFRDNSTRVTGTGNGLAILVYPSSDASPLLERSAARRVGVLPRRFQELDRTFVEGEDLLTQIALARRLSSMERSQRTAPKNRRRYAVSRIKFER